MKIKRLSITGFRNYQWEAVDFSKGTNVIIGQNAQGKTNLLEAVYYLSCSASFRTRFDRELINHEYSSCEILADIESYGREQTIKIDLRPGVSKNIRVNGVKKIGSDLAEIFNVVLFSPDDLYLVKDGAAVRRKFLDNAISQIRPRYAELISEYNRLYEQKTRILRDRFEKPSLLDVLDDFSDGLCRCSAQIIRYRAAYTGRMSELASGVHRDFSANDEELSINYKTVSTVTDPLAPAKKIYYQICEHQERHRQAELESCRCLTGSHKDDLEILINKLPARIYASQGQTRTAALSMKLAEREILLEETGEYPVLLLDDVLSELDERRQSFVLNSIGGGQTLISCCDGEEISRRTGGRVIRIIKGHIH